MKSRKFAAIILAAGQGTRMKSDLSKVLHAVGGKPMVFYPVRNAETLKAAQTILVLSKNGAPVKAALQASKTDFVVQNPPRGTGHAVMTALPKIKRGITDVVILYGDMPLVTADTLQKLISSHKSGEQPVTFVTGVLPNPFGYGRVVRDKAGIVEKVVEEKDADAREKKIREVNIGIYVINLSFLKKSLKQVKTKNAQKEFYLTDLIEIAAKSEGVRPFKLSNIIEGMGVNSQAELAQANREHSKRRLKQVMAEGVQVLSEDQIVMDEDVIVGRGTRLCGPLYLRGKTIIGENSLVEPFSTLSDTIIGNGVTVKSACYLDGAIVEDEASVGPMAHLRPQAHLKRGAKAGNFVEIKKSVIGEKSKINHLTYIGDALIGKNVNVGAGTITCNYDGKNKFKTVIEDDAFIGSDSQLVAPVLVGKGAYVGSGSTITKDVPPGSLTLTRAKQVSIPGWSQRRK